MGLFNKIKNMFKKDNNVVDDENNEKELEQETEAKEDVDEFDEIDNSNEVEKDSFDEENEEVTEVSDDVEEKSEDDDETKVSEIDESNEFDDESDDTSDVEESDFEDSETADTTDTKNEIEDTEYDKEDVVEEKQKKNLFGFKKKEKINKEDKIKEEVKVYEKGLSKSREGFVSKLANLTNKYKKITEEYFEELEEILIMADIGVNTVMDFMDRLRSRVKSENISDPSDLKEIIVDELFIIYVNDDVLSNRINYNENGPTVILFVGVNGVGKTTTIAKLANKLKDEGKKILLVGADTFRAGAVSQLQEWSEKVGTGFFGKEESDPASVVYDGLVKAKEENYDIVLVDTAGRLQNKVNLMKELEKMNKVIDSLIEGGASETLLVIDATTGQNGISQAKAFKDITNITGIVLTKLDGTAKGGIVLAIKEEVGIPVKYIGLGERKEDLQVFDIEKYIYGLFKDMM